MQKNAFMKNDKREKIIPVGGSFCEIEKGRTRFEGLCSVVAGDGGGDEDVVWVLLNLW